MASQLSEIDCRLTRKITNTNTCAFVQAPWFNFKHAFYQLPSVVLYFQESKAIDINTIVQCWRFSRHNPFLKQKMNSLFFLALKSIYSKKLDVFFSMKFTHFEGLCLLRCFSKQKYFYIVIKIGISTLSLCKYFRHSF